jgi:tetratricopeptide (TPR) repeat protein
MNVRACALVWLLIAGVALGDDLQGAAKTLSAIGTQAREIAANRKPEQVATAGEWTIQLAAFRDQVKSLSSDDQAARWLELLEQMLVLANAAAKRGEGTYQFEQQFTEWLQAVPPPAAWPAFQKRVEAKSVPDDKESAVAIHAMRLLAHTLANDDAACTADRGEVIKLQAAIVQANDGSPEIPGELRPVGGFVPSPPDFRDEFAMPMRHRYGAKPDLGKTPEEIAKNFEKLLDDNQQFGLQVPDLVTLLNAEKAEPLLKKALLKPAESFLKKLFGKRQGTPILIEVEGEETRKLAKKIVSENLDKVQAPLWTLIDTPEDAPLYEAFMKRFGHEIPWSNMEVKQQLAANCYLARMLDEDRLDDAREAITERLKTVVGDKDRYRQIDVLGQEDSRKMLLEEVRSRKLFKILDEMASADASSFPWGDYFDVADKSDQEHVALKHAQAILGEKNLSAADRRQLAFQLYGACLAQELVDEGVVLLKQHLAVRIPDAQASRNARYTEDCVQSALKLSELGRLIGNPDWEREGLDLAVKLFEESPADEFYRAGQSHEEPIVKRLLAMKRPADAERLLTRSLARWNAQPKAEPGQYYSTDKAKLLTALAAVYAYEGKEEDVLLLVEKAPWWQRTDLAEIVDNQFGETPLGLIVAKCLADSGKTEEAKKILLALIASNPGFDPPYEMLLAIDPAGAVVVFDRAAFNDPYEERPLIWKARYLLDQGNLAEAGKTIRQAILIDPSDGEQGKNRRMLAYSVLADVLEREGDVDGAKTFRKAVAAIRQAEKADDYHAAGLERRARALYKEALELFSDAYCIQSRLAIQLYEAGLTEEAAKHYQRAYELMPDSFGMIESHCFGCEGAFRGDLAQSLAEQVFEGLVQKHPEKPQVHYLLGYLRSTQGRDEEAIKHYQDAVKLAPNYLNAWSKLGELLRQKTPAPPLLDECIQAQLRLDPLGKHGTVEVEKARDLKKLWELLEASGARYTAPPKQLLPLPAAATALEQERKEAEEKAKAAQENRGNFSSYQHWDDQSSYGATTPPMKPGEAIAKNERFRDISPMFLQNR